MDTSVVLDKILIKELPKKIYLGNNRDPVNTFLHLSQLSLRLLSQEETGKWHKREGWLDGPVAAAGPSEQWEGVGHPLL